MARSGAFEPRAVPAVGRPRPLKLPVVSEQTLPNGLRVVAVRRPGVPRFEARLQIPTARRGDPGDAAELRVLAETLLSGTGRRSARDIAEDLQGMGGGLGASADAEQVILAGSALATAMRPFLELLAEVVTGAAYPDDEVALERDRVADELAIARSQPSVIAREALLGRLYPKHPYGRRMPSASAVKRVRSDALRGYHRERIRPDGGVLVLAGAFDPDAVLGVAVEAFAPWKRARGSVGLMAPVAATPARTLIVDRPGAVQTNMRLIRSARQRHAPDYPDLVLANTIFGGYFTSRLVDNIREKRGYTYSPHSGIEHRLASSHLVVSADVGTEVTAPALLETRYELGRMVATSVEDRELAAAKRYLQGTLAMGIQTQAGIVGYLSGLASAGLTLDFLREYPERIEALGADDVQRAAEAWLGPRGFVTVLVGDADAIRSGVEAFDEVEVR